jgi:hypothetical protein
MFYLFVLYFLLGGNSKCLMFCQLSPSSSSYQESVCSLQFATRANHTELGVAKKNINTGDLVKAQQVLKSTKESSKKFEEEKMKLTKLLRERQDEIYNKDDLIRSLNEKIKQQALELQNAKTNKDSLQQQINSLERSNKDIQRKLEDSFKIKNKPRKSLVPQHRVDEFVHDDQENNTVMNQSEPKSPTKSPSKLLKKRDDLPPVPTFTNQTNGARVNKPTVASTARILTATSTTNSLPPKIVNTNTMYIYCMIFINLIYVCFFVCLIDCLA